MLTRANYRQLATAVVEWGQEKIKSDQYFTDFVSDLCAVLEKTNPRFKPVEFVKACMQGR